MYCRKNYCNSCSNGGGNLGGIEAFADKREFVCGADRQVIKHQHVVKHQHDIINEYDVIHEHNYDYYDVVTTSDVVKHHDHRSHQPNYCHGHHNAPAGIVPLAEEAIGDCGCH